MACISAGGNFTPGRVYGFVLFDMAWSTALSMNDRGGCVSGRTDVRCDRSFVSHGIDGLSDMIGGLVPMGRGLRALCLVGVHNHVNQPTKVFWEAVCCAFENYSESFFLASKNHLQKYLSQTSKNRAMY